MAPVMPTLAVEGNVPQLLAKLSDEGARGIGNGRGFFDYSTAECEDWEERLRDHAWQIKKLIDEERPLEHVNDSANRQPS